MPPKRRKMTIFQCGMGFPTVTVKISIQFWSARWQWEIEAFGWYGGSLVRTGDGILNWGTNISVKIDLIEKSKAVTWSRVNSNHYSAIDFLFSLAMDYNKCLSIFYFILQFIRNSLRLTTHSCPPTKDPFLWILNFSKNSIIHEVWA